MKNIALIPARGGSKGIKRKNIKLLNNMPLIYWTNKNALSSNYIDRVVVSTKTKKSQIFPARFVLKYLL